MFFRKLRHIQSLPSRRNLPVIATVVLLLLNGDPSAIFLTVRFRGVDSIQREMWQERILHVSLKCQKTIPLRTHENAPIPVKPSVWRPNGTPPSHGLPSFMERGLREAMGRMAGMLCFLPSMGNFQFSLHIEEQVRLRLGSEFDCNRFGPALFIA
jgi:hypothetical protein